MFIATNLTKSFAGNVRAVRHVSLTLKPGRIMGLLGVSGSGKSTLLNLLAGLTDADGGEVRLDGERVPGPGEVLVAGHPQIRLVHQEYQLMPNVSIRENISYPLRFAGKEYRHARVDELLKRCHLTDQQNRLPRQVSGGEKQRAAIARALAHTPTDGRTTVLLLDEPFSHLDLPNRLLMRRLLVDMIRHDGGGARPVACLFVTHEAADALSLADTLGVLRNGKLIQADSPVAIYQQPATAYTARLTGPANILKVKYLPLLGLPDFGSTGSESDRPDALVCLRPEQIQLDEAGAAGVVRAVFFLGSHYEVEVAVSRYVCVRVLTTRPDLCEGQRVGLRVAAGSVWPLKS